MNVKRGIGFQRVFLTFLRITLGRLLALCLGFRYRVHKPKSKTYLLLANHNSDLDPIMTILGTGRHARFVASANILNGFLGSLLRIFFNPIPRNKGASADDTVELILQNLRAGISVAMFPEGNKSWDGETGFISPRTARLVKDSGVALVTYRLDGDYMKTPRWAKFKRIGPVFGSFVAEYSAERIARMTTEEVYEVICRDLYVDAYAVQREKAYRYPGKNLAEGMELTAYLCPCCHRFGTTSTRGDTIFCECGMKATLGDDGFLRSDSLPFDNLLDWSKWEKKYLTDKRFVEGKPITSDGGLTFRLNGKTISDDATVTAYPDKIVVSADKDYPFSWASVLNAGAFRTTRFFMSFPDVYVELYRKEGLSGIKYFTLWRVLSGLGMR